ncbi:MAG: PilN domain-containing protein [Planctomycetaceae bacterium]
MLPQIDFLPKSYRQVQVTRRRTAWRSSVAIAFLALALLGTFAQYRVRKSLEASRDELKTHAEKMASKLENDDVLYKRIRDLDAKANLVTRLRIRVAATKVLADVTSTLPQFVSLSEFRFNLETSGPRAAEKPVRGRGAQPVTPVLASHALDLSRLDELDERSMHTVSLRGSAPDDASVSNYLAALKSSGTFDEVHLLFTERQVIRDQELRSFGVRLRVRKPRVDVEEVLPAAVLGNQLAPVTESAPGNRSRL